MAVITVASIQSGAETIASGDGTSHDVTITSVTTANSIVMYSSRCAASGSVRQKRHRFIASLTGSTTLNFSRHESSFASDVIVEWTVVEFDSGVLNNLQTGTVDRTAANDDTTITAVDLAKTFVISHLKTDQNDLSAAVTCYAELTSTTNLRLASDSTPGTGDSVIGYQVVEFASDADVTVQGGTILVSSGSESNTDTITSVDTSKTFIINSGTSTSQTSSPQARNQARLKLTNSTTVTADRTTVGSETDMTIGYFAVELEGSGHAVESFDVTITDTNTAPGTQPSWTALSTTDSAIMVGWPNNRADNTNTSSTEDDNTISVSLDAGADGATVLRTGSDDPVYMTGFAVDFSGSGGGGATPMVGGLSLLGVGM